MNVLDEGSREKAVLWRLRDPGDPELLRARFRTRTFARHAHDRFAIGVIEAGGLEFQYRGQKVRAPAGWVNLAYPGEAHSGQATGPDGWAYRMFYVDFNLLTEIARGLDPGATETPFISAGAVWDPDLAGRIARLHRLCEDPRSEPLERQIGLCCILEDVLRRHSVTRPDPHHKCGKREVELARGIIEDTFEEPIQLEQLASLTGMNPFTLVRCFAKDVGLPPHAYLVQVRVNRAAEYLRRGDSPAKAASEAGFADQSHLNRHFLRHFGVTPGTYRKAYAA